MKAIDLEEFVDKEVVITNNSGMIWEGRLKEGIHPKFSYELHYEYGIGGPILYNRKGYNREGREYNIKHIELKPQKAMTPLSDATIDKLADALTADAIKYIESSTEYVETMVDVINTFLIDRMGQMDEILLGDICIGIFEQIDIVSRNK